MSMSDRTNTQALPNITVDPPAGSRVSPIYHEYQFPIYSVPETMLDQLSNSNDLSQLFLSIACTAAGIPIGILVNYLFGGNFSNNAFKAVAFVFVASLFIMAVFVLLVIYFKRTHQNLLLDIKNNSRRLN